MDQQAKRDRAADIGDEALDLEAGSQREAHIEGQCAGDSELTEYVREYLAGFKEVLATRHQVITERRRSAERVQIKFLHNRYKLSRLLGAGGMGKVFEAIDTKTNQPVAIKFLHGPYAGNEDMRMRLVREARAAGALHHPNIVAVHDIDQVKGVLFIVMDYVRGNTLANLIVGPIKISFRSRLTIMIQVAEALAYAHTQGIIHRDIKPANIMVRADGSVKVMDFGLAEQADLQKPLVQVAGTIPYMSPEQFGGHDRDARSDIWSIGITLFELLTGNIPYRSIQEIRSAPPPILPQVFPLSSELNAVLARALAKERQVRYPKAEDLADDLRRLLQMCDRTNLSAPLGDAPVFDDARSDRTGVKQPADDFTQAINSSLLGNFILPGLNFSCPTAGELGTMVGISKWKERAQSLLQERRNLWQSISSPRRYNGGAGNNGPNPTMFGLLPEAPKIGVAHVVFYLLGFLALVGSVAICDLLDGTERLPPLCQLCRLRMKRTARWRRFAKSKEEVIFGYRDVMNALKFGLWQEAAKLLSIHGTETISDTSNRFITPVAVRYRLDFFECELCSHHAARLTIDEMIEEKWRQQAKFGEAYWGTVTARPSILSRLAAAPRAYIRVLGF